MIFITGSNGTIGSSILEKLENLNFNVKGLVRKKCKISENHVNTFYSQSDLSQIFEKYKPKIIIHCAAQTQQSFTDLTFAQNNKLTNLIISLAEKEKVKLFIFLSSDLAKNRWGFYGKSKYKDEKSLESSSIKNKVIIRAGPVIKTSGEMSRSTIGKIFRKIDKDKKIIVPCPEYLNIRTVSNEGLVKRIIDLIQYYKNNRFSNIEIIENIGLIHNLNELIHAYAKDKKKKLKIFTINKYVILIIINVFKFLNLRIMPVESIRNALKSEK